MKRKLTKSDKRLLEIYKKELADVEDVELRNTARMPKLEGYKDAMQFCISHINFKDAKRRKNA